LKKSTERKEKNMSRIKGLTVIECPYNYNGWSVDFTKGEPIYQSALKTYEHPRVVEMYHEKGTYNAMGVPVAIREVNYDHYKDRYDQPYAGVTREFSDLTAAACREENAVLIAGGFCNYAPAIAGGLQRAYGTGKKIGVIWVDAHADCCIAETEGRLEHFVGVPMSTMLGLSMDDFRRNICGLEVPVKGENVLAGDIRIFDENTGRIFEREKVTRLDTTGFADEQMWSRAVAALAARVDVIYLSVDADILKAEYVPSYFKTVPYGNDPETVIRNVSIVMKTGKVAAFSTFCFDFDKYENGGEITAESGRRIVEAGLSAWKDIPER
jgi:arginase family enzyme